MSKKKAPTRAKRPAEGRPLPEQVTPSEVEGNLPSQGTTIVDPDILSEQEPESV